MLTTEDKRDLLKDIEEVCTDNAALDIEAVNAMPERELLCMIKDATSLLDSETAIEVRLAILIKPRVATALHTLGSARLLELAATRLKREVGQ